MDQWLEDDPTYSAYDESWEYKEYSEMTDAEFSQFCYVAYTNEYDCDVRSIQKIKDYNLESLINVTEYIQKALSYSTFYMVMKNLNNRKFYTIGKEPYNVEEIWKSMPTEFGRDINLTPALQAKYEKYCY